MRIRRGTTRIPTKSGDTGGPGTRRLTARRLFFPTLFSMVSDLQNYLQCWGTLSLTTEHQKE